MAEKKRLHHFLNDMLKLSCVKGFQHFATHMRGREEMVCSVVNEPSMPIIQSATNSPAVSFGHHQKREAFPMNQKLQRRLSGYGFINVGLPPASPSENEELDETQTMFLIAGYSRYNRPYVWVRTNHERLVRLSSEEEKDYPLMLQTTSQWQDKEVKMWDVLTELIEVCTAPCPPNPFAVDLDYFQSLPLPEKALASAAMISFLQRVIASGPHHFNRRIVSDIGKVGQIHFRAMQRLIQEEIIELPSPSPYLAPATQLTAREKTPTSVAGSGRIPSNINPVPVTGTKVLHQAPPSIPQPGYPTPRAPSGVQPRPVSSPPQYEVAHTQTPFSPPQPQPSQPQTQPTSAAPSGGQFYSRRMGGSYNY